MSRTLIFQIQNLYESSRASFSCHNRHLMTRRMTRLTTNVSKKRFAVVIIIIIYLRPSSVRKKGPTILRFDNNEKTTQTSLSLSAKVGPYAIRHKSARSALGFRNPDNTNDTTVVAGATTTTTVYRTFHIRR